MYKTCPRVAKTMVGGDVDNTIRLAKSQPFYSYRVIDNTHVLSRCHAVGSLIDPSASALHGDIPQSGFRSE